MFGGPGYWVLLTNLTLDFGFRFTAVSDALIKGHFVLADSIVVYTF